MGKASQNKKERREEILKKANYKPTKSRFGLYVTIAVIVIAALIATIVVLGNKKDATETEVDTVSLTPPGVVNDGFLLTKDGLVDAEPQKADIALKPSEHTGETNDLAMFVDYACPHCADFETANIDSIEEKLNNGEIDTLSIHPLAFLSRFSQDGANALSCVAEYDPKNVLTAHKTLMERHDKATTTKQIVALFAQVGIAESDELTKCVRGGRYNEFVEQSTIRAQQGPIPGTPLTDKGISGTPSVFLNGEQYRQNPASAEEFNKFVSAVLSGAVIKYDDAVVGN